MALSGKDYLDGSIRFALKTIPSDKLDGLFNSLGYSETDEPSLSLCLDAWEKFGEEFTKPFFGMALDALQDEDKIAGIRKEVMRQYNLSRADGKTGANGTGSTKTAKTDEEKQASWNFAESVLGGIFTICSNGYKSYTQAQAEANATVIAAQGEAAAKKAESEAQSNITKWALIGGGVLIAVVIVVAVVIAVKKK